MPITTVYTNNQYYQEIADAIRSKNGTENTYKPSQMAAAIEAIDGGTDPVLQSKTATSSTVSQTITPDASYDGLSAVTINAIATATQATPTISVSASGLITASVTQTAGYVTNGTKTATEQLITQSAVTAIPNNMAQTLASQGAYLTGDIKVNAVPTETATLVSNGTATPSVGKYFSSVTVNVPSDIHNQNKTITPTTTTQSVIADNGYSGLGTVTVNAIPSQYIIPEKTFEIYENGDFDITTYSEVSVDVQPTLQSKTVTPTESTQTISADTNYDGLNTVTIGAISPTYVGSEIAKRTSADITTQWEQTTIPAGYYANTVTTTMESGTLTSTVSIDANGLISAAAGVRTEGYVGLGDMSTSTMQLSTQSATTITPKTTSQTAVGAGKYTTGIITVAGVPTETTTLTSNGTHNATNGKFWSSVTVAVPSDINNQNKTVTSSTTTQTVSADSGYSGLGTVTISAMPISTIDNAVLNVATVTEATNDYGVEASITIPAGYYNTTTLSKVLSTVLPAPASAITISQMLAGYQAYDNEGQLLSGTMTNRASWGATLDQTTTSVTIPEGYHNGSGTVSHTTVNIPDPTFSIVNNTGVITASGTWARGFTTDNSYSKTYSLTTQTGTTITPTESAQTAVASYRWTTGTVTVAAVSSTYVGSGIARRTSLSASGATVTASAGYYANTVTATIASGTAKAPNTITGSSATVTAGTNILTFSKSISVTPVVTAGYISAGTATNVTVTLSAAIPTKAAATITPGTATQTISAGTYLSGAQTIVGDADLIAANIKSGINIFGTNGIFTSDADATASDIVAGATAYVDGDLVTGELVVNKYYTGATAPAASLGNNGDIYLQQ